MRNIGLSVLNEKGKPIVTHEMDMIFTHFGVSGPAVLRCSSFVYHQQQKTKNHTITLALDCIINQSHHHILNSLLTIQKNNGQQTLKTILKNYIPERLVLFYLEKLNLSPQVTINTLSQDTLTQLINLLKQFTFTVNGSLPIEKSFVTGGGVSIKEIDPKTMMSKIVSGLFCCGELLDVHGYTGGYNITAAFITGTVAGRNAASFYP